MADLLHHALLYIASLGAAGQAAFIVLYASSCLVFLPVSVLTFGAGALYGIRTGFALVWIGAMAGACASFLIGRHWLRWWVEKRLARHPMFAAIDAAVSAEGWRVVFLTRLTPLLPFTLQNYAYGLTRVKFGEYAAATCVGISPGSLMFVYLGAAAGEAFKAGTHGRVRTRAEWAFYGVGLLATVIAVTLIGREAGRALAKHVKPAVP
ncbi:MAG: TVP38/TMEM64 family protein [Elusimicrobia bacterium]|nr:TVP38/TMEM64 family protein [Elusimicrobiota bacterium]